MQQQKSKKILIYIFLLILVGSINNIKINNLKLYHINDINIIGLDIKEKSILLQKIKNLNLDNIFLINRNDLINEIELNSLVEKFLIFKRYPSSLFIKIEKTKFLARINDNGKIFLIGSNGKLTQNDFPYSNLPFIFGNPDINDFLNFKRIIDESKISYDEIKNLYFFSSKRWDLELRNNKIIKLSKNYSQETLKLISEFLYDNDFRDISVIDARIKNQIILND